MPGSGSHPEVDPALVIDAKATAIVASTGRGLCVRDASGALACLGEKTDLVAAAPAAATAVAFGTSHACAIAGGEILCWGAASSGQVGGAASYVHGRPLPVPGIDDAVAVDAGGLQACALRESGKVSCWGQWPQGPLTTDFAPRSFPALEPAREVRAAGFGPPGATNENSPVPPCARRGARWRCLDGTTPAPGAVVRLRRDLAVVSRDGACGVTRGGRLVCAGGAPVSTTRTARSSLVTLATNERFREATSLFRHDGAEQTCALTEAGRVRCFRLPSGDEGATPVVSASLAGLSRIRALSAARDEGASTACALAETGALWCWGDGTFGQLGPTRPRDFFEAVPPTSLPPVDEVAVGGSFVCARTTNGHLYCWGSNRNGTAPDGATGFERKPVVAPWPAR